MVDLEGSEPIIGSIVATAIFFLFIWPRVRLRKLSFPVETFSGEFVNYVRSWMTYVSVFALIIVIGWGVVVYMDLTTQSVTLWLAGSGAIVLYVVSRFPEAENAIAAVTVFFRNQVQPGQEFEIIYPEGLVQNLTLVKRNERFTYAQRFDGARSVVEIPHTVWVNSLVANLSSQPVRWVSKIPLRFALDKRDGMLDKVDEYVADSGFSDLPPEQVKYNYLTKLKPEIWGMHSEQVLRVYTMVSSREYGFEHENAFLDGLYRALKDIGDIEVSQGVE